ncbi:TetR/AcrR family transcriptional regulator [Geodermatophilus sp. SYSU D00691]
MTGGVKTRRRYDSSGRKEQARRTRELLIDTAERLLLEAGYAATTVAAIAAEAGVSVETVYKSFRGKSGLVRAIYDRGLLGAGRGAAYERSDQMRERETDPRVIMRKWGELTTEVASVITPIRLLIRAAAATDPEMASLLADSEAERLTRMEHHARFLAERGYLRDGVTVARAADVLWTSSSPEFYELLVLNRGWSPAEFARFVADFMIDALLPPAG